MKYLIVEDDFNDVKLLQFRLERLGYDVTLLSPGEAVIWNKKNKPGVVQLDGFGGDCFRLHNKLKKDNYNAEYLVFSARLELTEEAGDKGVNFFDKSYPMKVVEHAKKILEEVS